jgi:hypothetical protein
MTITELAVCPLAIAFQTLLSVGAGSIMMADGI